MPNTSKLIFKSHTAIGFYVKTMSAHGSHLGWRSWSLNTILKVYYPRTIHTMLADSGHFGLRSGSLNTILEVDHLRTIDDMFAILAY